jgi:hypothetical protein
LANLGINLVHLGASGERLTQAEVLQALSLQGDLFGPSLRSRRAYKPSAARTNAINRVRSAG